MEKRIEQKIKKDSISEITLRGTECSSDSLNQLLDMTVDKTRGESLDKLCFQKFPANIELDESVFFRLINVSRQLKSLRIWCMAECDEEANKELINFVIGVIQTKAPLEELSLPGFGGAASENAGHMVLEALCQQETSTLETINFSSNPLWWHSGSTVEMLTNMTAK